MIWLSENLGTIIVSLVLLLIVCLILTSMKRDKANGKSSCGGDCGHCGACHMAAKKNNTNA